MVSAPRATAKANDRSRHGRRPRAPEARLKYAITATSQATSHVLDLARLTAVSTSVEGVAELINEVSREAIRLPIIDFADMASIIDSQEIDCGKYDRLLLDEAQDVQDVTLFCLWRISESLLA